jgi:hypothetical protein
MDNVMAGIQAMGDPTVVMDQSRMVLIGQHSSCARGYHWPASVYGRTLQLSPQAYGGT